MFGDGGRDLVEAAARLGIHLVADVDQLSLATVAFPL
jgi:hypothetical protein